MKTGPLLTVSLVGKSVYKLDKHNLLFYALKILSSSDLPSSDGDALSKGMYYGEMHSARKGFSWKLNPVLNFSRSIYLH